jgi:23S rRNA pseudouridine1911/1915/1917 synthase
MPESKRTRVKELLQSGLVHVNGQSVSQHDYQIGPKDKIETRQERAAPARKMPFDILFEDAHLVAIDKPNGLLTVSNKHEKSRTVYSLVNRSLVATRERAFIVHRLDLYTSGVLILAKTEEAQSKIMGNWKSAKKVYHALVEGVPSPAQRTLTHHLREDERLVVHAMDMPSRHTHKATLSYSVQQQKGAKALLKIDLETGKKNQIRAQLAAIGHPICGDAKYGATTTPLQRLCLHASSLSIPHPKTGARITFQAPLPEGFRE